MHKALYFGILPIYRAFFASSVCNIFILCKVFLTRNNAFLTRIAHVIAHKKRPSDPQTRGEFSCYINLIFLSKQHIPV